MLAGKAADDSRGRQRRLRSIWSSTRDVEIRFNQVVRRHLHEIETEVLAKVEGVKGWMATQQKAEADDLLFDANASKQKLINQTSPLHRLVLKRGGDAVLAELGVGADFSISDPRVTSHLAELSHKITRIDDTIEAALRESLVEGIGEGNSPQELAKRVREVMDASKSRSMTIARTETGQAFNTGRVDGMQQVGVERHEWLAWLDDETRDEHVGDNGQVVYIGQQFPNSKLRYPLEPGGPPGQIINCRCTIVPVLGSD